MDKFSPDEQFQQQLQAFLSGDLAPEEERGLRSQLAASEEAAGEFAFSKKLNTVLQNRELLEVKTLVAAAIDREGFPPPPPKTGTGWWAGAASILLLLSLSGLWLADVLPIPSPWRMHSQRLSQPFLLPLENVIRTPERGGISQLQPGLDAYDKGDYPEAVRLLNDYVQASGDLNAALYLGVAQLLSGEASAAESTLEGIVTQAGEEPLQQTAAWYLALTYLQLGKTTAAREQLQSLPEGSPFAPGLEQLKEELEQ